MSSPPPIDAQTWGAPQKAPMSPVAKFFIGCGIGCLVIVVLLCAGGAAFFKFIVKPMVQVTQKAQEAQKAGAESRRKLVALDVTHPPLLPVDVATAPLTGEDIARYVRIRQALAPQLAEVELAAAAAGGPDPRIFENGHVSVKDVAGAASDMLAGAGRLAEARAALLAAALPAVEAEGIGPTDLARMAEVVEWRFLRRPEAAPLGLPDDQRSALVTERLALKQSERWHEAADERETGASESEGSARRRARVETRSEERRARVEALEARAREATALSAATTALLEAHRAELESAPAGVANLGMLTSSAFDDGVDGAFVHVSRSRSRHGRGGSEGAGAEEDATNDDENEAAGEESDSDVSGPVPPASPPAASAPAPHAAPGASGPSPPR